MTLLREGEGINFQKASYTLDGCVKVYTSRIDSFEADTRKLLLGLNSQGEEPAPALGGNQAEATQGIAIGVTPQQLAKTLEDNAALTADSLELDFAADPLFQKTAADFDEGGAKGLLLSHLSISAGGKILFDAGDTSKEKGQPPAALYEASPVDMEGFRAKFASRTAKLDSLRICPTFSSFLFNSDAVQDFEIQGVNREDFYYNNCDDELSDYELAPDAPEQERSGLGIGFQDFEGMNDDYGDFATPPELGAIAPSDMEEVGPLTSPMKPEVMQRNVMKMVVSTAPHQDENIFSYFDAIPGKNWAGPEFWKSRSLKRMQSNRTNFVAAPGSQPAAKAPVKKKTKVALDFLNAEPLDIKKVFATSNVSTLLPKSKLQSENLHLLPPDMSYNSDRLFKLFLKPRFKVCTAAGNN
ncbi:hypothetical protein HDU91_002111 [Kappamyces sp. JEL0680]|nr:hypothetical protein HDU91_002111 [Kappamyces sp. JEL0680]